MECRQIGDDEFDAQASPDWPLPFYRRFDFL